MARCANSILIRGILFLLVAGLSGSLGAESAVVVGPLRFAAVEFPGELQGATDVRWSADHSLTFGVRDRGLYAWKVGAENARLLARSPVSPCDYGRVGISGTGTIFSGLLFGYYRLADGRPALEGGFELVADLDRRESSSLVIGLRRNAASGQEGRYEDHIGWLVADGEEPRGLVPTLDAGRGMDWCAGAQLPVGRFVSKDRVVVVPGAEPGAYVYDTEGKLAETLSAVALGIEEGCHIERDQMFALSKGEYATAWLNRRVLVDEIVGDGDGAFWLFVRRFDKTSAKPICWDLVATRLGETDRLVVRKCIVASADLAARLRADLRGERLVVLLTGGEAEVFLATLRPERGGPSAAIGDFEGAGGSKRD